MEKEKMLKIGGFIVTLVGFGISLLSDTITSKQQDLAIEAAVKDHNELLIKKEVADQLQNLLTEVQKDS